MVWAPVGMALGMGLLISAGIYFIFLWPAVEPDDSDSNNKDATTTTTTTTLPG